MTEGMWAERIMHSCPMFVCAQATRSEVVLQVLRTAQDLGMTNQDLQVGPPRAHAMTSCSSAHVQMSHIHLKHDQ